MSDNHSPSSSSSNGEEKQPLYPTIEELDINNNNNNNNNNNSNNNKQKKKKKEVTINMNPSYEGETPREPRIEEEEEEDEEYDLEEYESGIILEPVNRDPSNYRPQSLYNSSDEIRKSDEIFTKISKTLDRTNKKIKKKLEETNTLIEESVKKSNKKIEKQFQDGWDTVSAPAVKAAENIRESRHRRIRSHEDHERAIWIKDKQMISKYECLDYVTIYNKAYRLELYKNFNKLVSDYEWLRWIVSFFMGVFIGVIAYLAHIGVSNILKLKFSFVEKMIEYDFWLGFLAYFTSNTVLATLSSLLAVYYEPTAAGSGIPEVKGYLNGTKIPHTLKMKTLWTKLVSMIFAVSANLQVGAEGPMIHIGAIVGNGFSQAQSKEIGFKIPFLRTFRNDKDKRDFVTSGAGAGVAAAFGAPLGGALFSLEEVSSFWSTSLTWRCFFACMIATFTMKLLQDQSASLNGLMIFNMGIADKQFAYKILELVPFIIIGVLGGLAGAAFTAINVRVTAFRREKINKIKSLRVLEVFMIAALSTIFQFILPLMFKCKDIKENLVPGANVTESDLEVFKQFNCEEGEYNELASIIWASNEEAVTNLLSINTAKFANTARIGIPALLLFFVFYILFAAYTAGSGISSGTFVPMIVIGAAYGRAVGVLVTMMFPSSYHIDPGVYAIMGAAAFMGGVSRLTISLTVILIEVTNQLQYLLPIMITIMVAKWTADALCHPFFDILIQMKYIPYLEPHPSKEMKLLVCKHIMAKKPVYCCEKDTLGNILEILKETNHNGFPVVNNDEEKLVKGVILRSQLVMVLERISDVYIPNSETVYSHMEYTTRLTWKLPKVEDFSFDPADYDLEVDLSDIMNITVVTVNVEFAVSEAFQLFRTMGLRHMPVVNDNNKLKGIITKKDLLEKTCEQRYLELSHMKLGIDQLLHEGDE